MVHQRHHSRSPVPLQILSEDPLIVQRLNPVDNQPAQQPGSHFHARALDISASGDRPEAPWTPSFPHAAAVAAASGVTHVSRWTRLIEAGQFTLRQQRCRHRQESPSQHRQYLLLPFRVPGAGPEDSRTISSGSITMSRVLASCRRRAPRRSIRQSPAVESGPW
jgi:hypothetical protein